jgi:molybdopterin-binding protein
VSNIDPGTSVHACIRPEEVTLTLTRDASSARNAFQGAVTGLTLLGPFARMELDCGFPLVALITVRSAEEMGLKVGCRVYASFKATGVHFIPL